MNKYTCDKCNKNFSSEKTLETHKNKYHCLKIDIQNADVLNELSTNDNQILHFNNYTIKYFIHDNKCYYKARDIAKILKYVNTKDAIKKHVLENDKFMVSNLKKEMCNHDNTIKHTLKNEHPQTIFINENGMKALILKSNKSNSIELAKHLNINIVTKYLKKELEIITFFEKYLKKLNIVYILQKSVEKYKIDLYLPNNNIAIEIDEYGHIHREPTYEKNRENTIKSILNCKFLRINPDTENFNLATCIADLTQIIYSNIDGNTCCVCYDNSTLRKLPTCNHELCDECYYKLNNCPQCRNYYGNYKLSDSLFDVTNEYLDKFKNNCIIKSYKILEDLLDDIRVFNNLFSRTICYVNKKTIWYEPSVDECYLNNLINYREHTYIISKRKVLKNKALDVYKYLSNELTKYDKSIIPHQLHNIYEQADEINIELKIEQEKTKQLEVKLQIEKDKTRQLELEIEFYKLKNNL